MFGWKTRELCTFKVLPDTAEFSVAGLAILFLFRNPVAVWNGWVKRGWDLDINLFFAAYEHLHATLISTLELLGKEACGVVIFDRMHTNPAGELERMCRITNIQYDAKMLDWQVAWGNRRGGNTGNPDIDEHPTFAKNRVIPNLTIAQDVEDLIIKRLGDIWKEVNEIASDE